MFPNALNGVKKIYTAEILMLIAAILGIVTAIAAITGVLAAEAASQLGSSGLAGAAGGTLIGAGLFAVAAAVLSLIGFIMNIVGVTRAARDEERFKSALTAIIIGIVCSVLSGFFQSGWVSVVVSNVSEICEILATYFILSGIIHLAEQLGDREMASRGTALRKLILIIWVVSFVLGVISGVFALSEAMTVAGRVVGIIALIVSLVSYIMYLRLLSQARKMLGA